MKILNKVSIKNLKLNKKRTFSTIIGIMLSVALICAVAAMANSLQATLVQNAVNETGYYHIQLEKITAKDLTNIQNNRDIKQIEVMYDNGYAYFNNTKEYIHVYSSINNSLQNLSYQILQGREPKNQNEIAINKLAATDGNYKVGDTITLAVGTRKTLDGYDLSESNPNNQELEKLIDTVEKTYTIVGIVTKTGTNYSYYAITANDTKGKIDAYCALKQPANYKEAIPKLIKVSDYSAINNRENYEKSEYDYKLNRELLRWEVFAVSDSTISMLYSVVAVVLCTILFTSVFCIRNSFAISTLEKIKMYGMFASIGATKKQIKRSVLFEGMILGLIGIPLGILAGFVAVFILIQIVNLLLGEYLLAHVDGIVFKITWLPIILSVVLGLITIYLSAISSARKASKVSPIEQLKNNNDIKIKSRKLKTPSIIQKLFKTGGVLAYKNLKRSKKKYRTTVISLAISIFVFITINSFVTNAFNYADNYYTQYDYNMMLSAGTIKDFTEADVQKIREIEGINQCYFLYDNYAHHDEEFKIKDKSKINLIGGELELSEDSYIDEVTNKRIYTGEQYAGLRIRALDDTSFRKYAEKIGADYEKVKASGILCDDYQYQEEGSTAIKTIRRYKYQENDVMIGSYQGKEMSIKVGKVTDIRPYGMERTYYENGFLIVNEAEHKELGLTLNNILIQTDKPEEVSNSISSLYSSLNITNFDEEVKKENAMVLVINIFLYGFIAVITLIGVTNIFNTITSNMELRQKEFAMLKSIGMTKREFNRMINLETIFYGTKALFYGIILGLLGTFAMYKAFSVKIDNGMYIPVKPIILSAIFVFIIVFIIMRYSISKINKQNTIETIRKENI